MYVRLRQDKLNIWDPYAYDGSVTVWKLTGRPPPATTVSSDSPSSSSSSASSATSSASSASPSVVRVAEIRCQPLRLDTAVDVKGKTVAVAAKTSFGPAPNSIHLYDIERQAVIRVIPVNHSLTSMFWLGKEDLLLGQKANSKPEVQVGRDRVYAVTDCQQAY